MFRSIFRSIADIEASLGGCWSSKPRRRIFGNVQLGKNVFIADDVLIEGSKEVRVGDDVVIGPRVLILNTNYDLDLQKHLDSVLISNGVYVGPGAIICPGVKIEETSVVCPGAVVSSNVPYGKFVSGNPAVVLENVEKREAFFIPKGKGKIRISGSTFDRLERNIFKERLSFRGGVWKVEKSKKRIYEPISGNVEIGYDVLVEGEGDIVVQANAVIGHRAIMCTTEHRMEFSPVGVASTVYPTIIEDEAIIEPGSIIMPGIRIGEGALIKAGSVVTKNVPPHTKVSGNPAKPEKLSGKREAYNQLEPMFTRNFAKLSNEETKTFAGALHLYRSFIEKTYHVKSKENEIVFINSDVFLGNLQQIEFKGQVLLAPRSILTSSYGFYGPTELKEISIGDDVWIGAGAIILSGVTLGNGAIVGAGSVIKDDVPENTIVIGNPAKPLKQREIKEIVDLGELFSRFERHSTFRKRLLNSIKASLLHYIYR